HGRRCRLLGDRGRFQWVRRPPRKPRRHAAGRLARAPRRRPGRHVPVARPRAAGSQRGMPVVPAPRRIRERGAGVELPIVRRDHVLGFVRIAFATLGVIAMTYQYAWLDARGAFSAGNFFSFFTIQGNILAATMLVLVALVRPGERSALFDAARGAVTLYIAITGVVFALLLEGHQETLNTTVGW